MKTGGAAFPKTCMFEKDGVDRQDLGQDGMTLRDYYKAQALAGFCANPAVFAQNGMTGWGLVNCNDAGLVGYCGFLADLMIQEGEKKD